MDNAISTYRETYDVDYLYLIYKKTIQIETEIHLV